MRSDVLEFNSVTCSICLPTVPCMHARDHSVSRSFCPRTMCGCVTEIHAEIRYNTAKETQHLTPGIRPPGRRPPDFGQVPRQTAISLAGCVANGHLAGRMPGKRPSRVAALAERMACCFCWQLAYLINPAVYKLGLLGSVRSRASLDSSPVAAR